MICQNCGTAQPDGKLFCTNCGQRLADAPAQAPIPTDVPVATDDPIATDNPDPAVSPEETPKAAPDPEPRPGVNAAQPVNRPAQSPLFLGHENEGDRPVGIWRWLGVFALSMLPVVNFIMIIVWACCAKRRSLKNYARATVICWLVTLILLVLGGIALAYSGIFDGDTLYRAFEYWKHF